MPIINRIANLHDEVTEWRRDLHANPELQYDVHRTAGVVTSSPMPSSDTSSAPSNTV